MPITTASGDRVTLDGSAAEINTPKFYFVARADESEVIVNDLYHVELHGKDATTEAPIAVRTFEMTETQLVAQEAGFVAAWNTVASAFKKELKDRLVALNGVGPTFTIS